MKIGELAKRSGLSAHTVRYYERIGLLPYALRDRSGRRDYDASILVWIAFLGRLKATGMPIREMLRYAALREKGAGTEPARREILERHRDRVRARASELDACLAVLDAKISGYAETEVRINDQHAALPGPRRKPSGTGKTRLAEIDGRAGENVISALTDIAPDFAIYLLEFPFGDIYSRPGLGLRDREIATIAALAAISNAAPQLVRTG